MKNNLKHFYITTSGADEADAIKNLKEYLNKEHTRLDEIPSGERIVLIDDDLEGLASRAWENMKDRLEELQKENPDWSPEAIVNYLRDHGIDHEIADASTPIYFWNINCLWLTHWQELEESYNNMGFGDNPRENNGMTAIYCYLFEHISEEFGRWEDEQLEQWTLKQDEKINQ